MALEPNDLLLFARIVEAGSFSRAAERLNQPKSTVSRRLAQLESLLGERLLQRTTRKLVVTEFGQSLLDHARKVVEEVEAVGALAQHRQAEPSGKLRISMPSDFAAYQGMNRVLAAFVARYPKVDLELDLSPRRVDLVAEGFDIAIRMGDLPEDSSLAARRVVTEDVALFAAPSYLSRRGVPEHPDDLLEHDLLSVLRRIGGSAPWELTRGKTVWRHEVPNRILANSPDVLARVAREGAGIATSSYMFTREMVERGELVRVLPEWTMPSDVGWAVFPGRRLMPAKTRAFLDLMTEHCCSAKPHGKPGSDP
ncbi:MAG TPA: LysR family transcriptional regulator [Telluria sp.]|nr:LysR family transcriptional regulator [Telluria sp.]